MSDGRDVQIRIRGENLAGPAFDDARQGVGRFKTDVKTASDDVSSTLRGMAATMAGAFSFRDIASGIKEMTDAAGSIADSAAQVGITAESFQRLKFAAEQSGSSMDNVATAMSRMSDGIVEGSTATQKQLEAIGLELADLQGMAPDQAFLKITAAIRALPDPMAQASAAMNLFGKGGAALLPAIKAGFEEVGSAAPVMSNAVVDSGDQVGDAMDQMAQRMAAAKANALLPLLQTFTSMPDSVQTAIGGIAAFTPSMETMTALVIGVGGPKAALAGLASVFTTTLPAAIAAVVPFFTATLPAAFSAILPFLGPIGVIAAGVGAVVLAWKNWDTITGFVKGVYDGVKTWLVDKFAALIGGVKEKIDAVTGFFADMYDAVVGNSYVPDMVQRIRDEFGRLGGVMVDPTRLAIAAVTQEFKTLESSSHTMTLALQAVRHGAAIDWNPLSRGASAAVGEAKTHVESLADSITKSLGGALKDMPKTIMAAFTGGGDIGASIGGLLSKSVFGAESPLVKSLTGGLSKTLGSTIGGALGSVIPGLGTMLGGMAGQFIGPLIGKVGDAFKSLFGGPSAKELAGRDLVRAFEDNVIAMLSGTQRLEAGNERWKQTVVGIRDAYIAAGHTAAEGEAAAARLWASSKQGGEASKRVIEEIAAVMQSGVTAATNEATSATQTWQGAMGAAVAGGVTQFGVLGAQLADLKARLGPGAGLTGELAILEEKMAQAAANGVTDFSMFAAELDRLKAEIGRPVTIDVVMRQVNELPNELTSASGEHTVSSGWQLRPGQTWEQARAEFLARNPGDEHRFLQGMTDAHRIDEAMVNVPGQFHAGGVVRAHRGMFLGQRLAADEVPIIAQTGEAVLNRSAVAAIGGAAGVNALNRGGGGSRLEALLEQLLAVLASQHKVVVLPVKMTLDEILGSGYNGGSLAAGNPRLIRLINEALSSGAIGVPHRAIGARSL